MVSLYMSTYLVKCQCFNEESVISGTTVPQACNFGYVINKIGAAFPEECDICPAGKICPYGAVIAQDCTPGEFIEDNFMQDVMYLEVQGASQSGILPYTCTSIIKTNIVIKALPCWNFWPGISSCLNYKTFGPPSWL